ncbi:SRPBCC family protein [Caulobacter hibisci]|uniref:SRPBCC family protein n=1 Tax=Caulobacter hibisci TaxID=2035993 RepID=UPI001E52966A|nr:SRPBCC family protein [Caulobacter hibisci]
MAAASPGVAASSPDNSPQVAAEVRAGPDGRGEVRATIDIAAPPEHVWKVILDCSRARRMTPSVKRCIVLERSPDGRMETREHQIKRGLFSPLLRSISRLELDPVRRIAFRCIDGDIKDCEGRWLLTPLNQGAGTRVIYENRASAPFGLPSEFAAAAMRRDVPAALLALKRECLETRP